MAFTDAEKTDVRRFAGYPAFGGAGSQSFQNWRFYQAYGLLEFRLNNLSSTEEAVVRRYLATLATLEDAVPAAGDNLDTDRAAVWERNRAEVRDRARLFDSWRRRMCGFLGIPPGPALGDAGLRIVV